MAKWFDEIKNIVSSAKDETEARFELYKYGMSHGYCTSGDAAHERFLTNCLEQPIEDILKNPNVLYTRDKCKDDYQNKEPLNEEIVYDNSGVVEILSFDDWCNRHNRAKEKTFYDVAWYVSTVMGSHIFDTFLNNARHKDKPVIEKIKDPAFIKGHVEQFVEENEWRLSNGEKRVIEVLKDLCRDVNIDMPELLLEMGENKLWSPLEFSDMEVCGMLVMDKNTKESYVIKIS